MARRRRQLRTFYQEISADIYKFCRALNFTPTDQQRELFDSVQRGCLRIAVKSGQGPGKTTASGIVALWRTIRHPGALTILTAPTMRQCNEVWLAEVRRVLARADPTVKSWFNVTKTKIEIAGDPDWSVKTVTATQPENAQGFHERNMTIICEEASGIPRPIMEQFKGTASNPGCLFLQIGNPNTRDCAFFDCFHSMRHLWETYTWNAEETPTSEWFDLRRNKEIADEFGIDSDVYRVRVLGEFPFQDPNCVMSSEDIERVMGNQDALIHAVRTPRRPEFGGGFAKQFGIDLARFGSDESTIYRRAGNAIVEWKRFSHVEPADVITHSWQMQQQASWANDKAYYVVDAGGMGQGVLHLFYRAGKQLLEFHNGGKPADSQYADKITEAWFHLARLVKAQECYLPKDNLLVQQLAGRQYYTNKKGKLILESKDEYMKRGYNSPDRADGCVMSFYDAGTGVGKVTSTVYGTPVGSSTRIAT